MLNLLEITGLRGQAHELYVKEIQGRPDRIVFTMYEKAMINPVKIPELIAKMDGAMTFKKADPVQFIYTVRNSRQKTGGSLIEITGQILEQMKILLEE